MTWFSGALVFVVLWWIVFFITLPIGATSYHEIGEEVEPGHVAGTPLRARLGLKAFITTLVSLVLTVFSYFLIESGLISFRT